MKRFGLFLALLFVFAIGTNNGNVIAGTPHTAYGKVFNSDGSVPADGEITFNSYIVDRPDEVQTESSTGCSYSDGYWSVAVGNFETAWSVGEVLRTDVTNTVNGETGSVDVVMTDAGSDQAEDLYLEPTVPVELSSFNVFTQDRDVILQWSTESETNNFGFEIHRKVANEKFKKVGFVPGNGTTTLLNRYNYKDIRLPENTYYYRLKQVDYNGAFDFSEVKSVLIGAPIDFTLEQNFPNPFNAETILRYQISPQSGEPVNVKLLIYNSLGELIRTLVDENQSDGQYSVIWDGRDNNGQSVSSGVYISRMIIKNHISNLKMIYMK